MAEEPSKEKVPVAVALKYEAGKDQAPRVAAKGRGPIAEQIIKIAEEQGIAIREDASLVEILAKIDIDTIIPLEAYNAVAEILNFVYKTNAKARSKRQKVKL